MAENRTRTRKRDRYLRSQVHFDEDYGHTTAGGGRNNYNSHVGVALLWQRREWMEDVNHREHYTLYVIGEDGSSPKYDHATIKGTMSRLDRGSPMWLRRIERNWPRSSIGPYKRIQGIPIDGVGNWSIINWGMSQITGPGAGYTTSVITTPPAFPNVPAKSEINFNLYSPKGWNKFRPAKSKVSTTQFLAELRDLPRIPFRLFERAKFFRSLGKEYLNFEFGWKPFVSDLISFFEAYLAFNERYEQLVRDNGKPVRRKGAIYSNVDTSSTRNTSGAGVDLNLPVGPTWVYGGSSGFSSTTVEVSTIEQKYWFSGRFRYYLAPFGSTRYNEQILRIIYGIDLTPQVVYELLPWSWLLDWATNVGDNIANATAAIADGLVADYAYTMGEYVFNYERTVFGPLSTCVYTEVQTVKARDQATPYGFGLDTSSFTSRQKAILAALLLARS